MPDLVGYDEEGSRGIAGLFCVFSKICEFYNLLLKLFRNLTAGNRRGFE